ncbi:hypothetical protein DFH09DRAFT_1399534 [Mycena vulgaris]|nr:hypothetical protein DFH09DRAFT_1399534 [Mycena vulgaris]
MTYPEPKFPNEIWMRSFQLMDRRTLKCVRLVCHLFASLAWDVILRDITWSPARAVAHAEGWKENPSLSRDLSVYFALPSAAFLGLPRLEAADQVARIFKRILSFSYLEALTLFGADIPENFHDFLRKLPSLKELALEQCVLPPALAGLPISPLPEYPSNVINLKVTLYNSHVHPQDWTATIPCAGLFVLLPRLHTLHIERCFLPTDILAAGITSLTIGIPCADSSAGDAAAKAYLCKVLRKMPQLRRLTAHMRTFETHPDDFHPHQILPTIGAPPSLLYLTHFTGADRLGLVSLLAAPALEDVRVTGRRDVEAIEFIESLQERNVLVRRLTVELPGWSAEVARAATRCLPQCEHLEIVYGIRGDDQRTLVLSATHVLEDVVIELDSEEAIDLIEFLQERNAPVRRLSVELRAWSSEVVRAVTRCLPQCERLEITYTWGELSQEALVNLGTEFVPRLTHLREISILHGPEKRQSYVKDAVQDLVSLLPETGVFPDLDRELLLAAELLAAEPKFATEVDSNHEELVEREATEDKLNLREGVPSGQRKD